MVRITGATGTGVQGVIADFELVPPGELTLGVDNEPQTLGLEDPSLRMNEEFHAGETQIDHSVVGIGSFTPPRDGSDWAE